MVGLNYRARFGSGKNVKAPPPPAVIYYSPFQCGNSVVASLCYLLCLDEYGLQQYVQLNNSCYPSCFLFCSVL